MRKTKQQEIDELRVQLADRYTRYDYNNMKTGLEKKISELENEIKRLSREAGIWEWFWIVLNKLLMPDAEQIKALKGVWDRAFNYSLDKYGY